MEILITNDDGVNAKGIGVLVEIMKEYGNITVIAPKEAQSGMSVALSIGKRLDLECIREEEGLRIYSLTGTPVDCVKMGINELFPQKAPDMIISGINHGSNASVAALYSGTLGATIEGTISGIPSIGFSLTNHDSDCDFSCVKKYGNAILDLFLSYPPSCGVYLNVNFPDLPPEEIKGIRIGHSGAGRWTKEFEKEIGEDGKECFRMIGTFLNLEPVSCDADHILVKEGYISVVPHKIDTTDYGEIERLRNLWNIK